MTHSNFTNEIMDPFPPNQDYYIIICVFLFDLWQLHCDTLGNINMWVSQVLDHHKRMHSVTVGLARKRTINAQWLWVPSVQNVVHHFHPFTGICDVSIWVKNSEWEKKSTIKHTNYHWTLLCHMYTYFFQFNVLFS